MAVFVVVFSALAGFLGGRAGARLLRALLGKPAPPLWCEAGCALGWLPLPALGWWALAGAAVVCWLVCLSVADVTARILPNALTLPGAVLLLLAAAASGRGAPALIGALGFAGSYLVVHLVAPRAMGAGDVKLALGLGALCGAVSPSVLLTTVFAASLFSAAAAVALVLRRRRGATIAHGASMCLAAYLALVFALV